MLLLYMNVVETFTYNVILSTFFFNQLLFFLKMLDYKQNFLSNNVNLIDDLSINIIILRYEGLVIEYFGKFSNTVCFFYENKIICSFARACTRGGQGGVHPPPFKFWGGYYPPRTLPPPSFSINSLAKQTALKLNPIQDSIKFNSFKINK